jgi:uroporphyrinogen III methyltransferase/synthase
MGIGNVCLPAGKVYIVGAGPGSADLITLRGYRALREADVLICDNLVPRSFLEDLGVPICNKVIQWLGSGPSRMNQLEINQLMLDAAREGKIVVRLKTGDPFVFGRGSEEVEFLSAQNIPWEVIPGPSICTGGLSAGGFPLTRRGEARSFAAVTARCAGGALNESYPRADSLVVFMGIEVINEVVERLLRDGWKEDTPAALLERATMAWERRAEGSLQEIGKIAEDASIQAPAILVVGRAASRQYKCQSGPRILFTGLDPSNFRVLGEIMHWPAIQMVRDEAGYRILPKVIARLKRKEFDRVIFTSKAGVKSFFEAIEGDSLDARLLAGTTIVVAGAGTGLTLAEYGLRADAVASRPGSQGILLASGELSLARVLLVQGSHAPQGLEDSLKSRGAEVTRLALHRVVPHPELGRPLPEHDIIYFVSPSGVRSYWETYGEGAFKQEVWCIGEVTLAEVRKLGREGKVVSPYVSAYENAKAAAH